MDRLTKTAITARKHGMTYGKYVAMVHDGLLPPVDTEVITPEDLAPNKKAIQCRNCGKVFVPRYGGTRYCTDECWLEYNRKQRERSPIRCRSCGKSFIPKGCRAQYCSDVCREKANRDKARERGRKNREERPPISCVVCGEAFVPTASRQICCSKACSRERERILSRRSRRKKVSGKEEIEIAQFVP